MKSQTVHPAIAGDAPWQRATCEYVARLRDHYGEKLVTVVLYGSRARGDADVESDVDLLVVLRGPFEASDEEQIVAGLRAGIEEKYEVYALLCPVVAPEAEYRQRMLPFLMNARREGIDLIPPFQATVREEPGEYTGSPKKELDLIRQRMNNALDDAIAGIAQDRIEWAVNRAYYAMFHAVTALLLSEGLAFSRHRGVISAFDQYWVNSGRFPATLGKALRPAFDLRNKADYAYSEPITKNQAQDLVRSAASFVAEADRLLSSDSKQ